jgi:hypothetical protein
MISTVFVQASKVSLELWLSEESPHDDVVACLSVLGSSDRELTFHDESKTQSDTEKGSFPVNQEGGALRQFLFCFNELLAFGHYLWADIAMVGRLELLRGQTDVGLVLFA